jgi:GxxExxY protein
MEINEISETVIGCAIRVHRELEPGLLESAYQTCLLYELKTEGLLCRSEVPMPITYRDVKLDHGYRMDILVEEKITVEIKTVEAFTDVHHAQVLTYLRLVDYRLGLLLNFNVKTLKDGVKRIANSL